MIIQFIIVDETCSCHQKKIGHATSSGELED